MHNLYDNASNRIIKNTASVSKSIETVEDTIEKTIKNNTTDYKPQNSIFTKTIKNAADDIIDDSTLIDLDYEFAPIIDKRLQQKPTIQTVLESLKNQRKQILNTTRKWTTWHKDSTKLGLPEINAKIAKERGKMYSEIHGPLEKYVEISNDTIDDFGHFYYDKYDTRFYKTNPFEDMSKRIRTKEELFAKYKPYLDDPKTHRKAQWLLENQLKYLPETELKGASAFTEPFMTTPVLDSKLYSQELYEVGQMYGNVGSEKIYFPMNRYWNGVKQEFDDYMRFNEEQILKKTKKLDNALKVAKSTGAPFIYDKPTIRYMQINNKEVFNQFLNEYEVGNIVENLSFWSSTKNAEPELWRKQQYKNAKKTNFKVLNTDKTGFDPSKESQFVVLKIYGKQGIDISGASQAQFENEVLFPRNSKYYIAARRQRSGNIMEAILHELDPSEVQ